MYTAMFGTFDVMTQRAFPLMMAMIIIFLWRPLGQPRGGKWSNPFFMLIDLALIAGAVFSCGYVIINFHDIANRMGFTTLPDIAAGSIGLICLLEATRRTTGNALAGIALFALIYIFVGPYMPGILYHEGYNLARTVRIQWTGLTGVFGTIQNAMVTIIYIFILFASFLRVSKAGDYIIQIALAFTGRFRGGPALSAVLASMLFGSVSGSPVANVAGTGTFTIPLMKQYGFRASIAGCVEAAASSGGYLMPPIMGAAAFIMAEFMGVPYVHIMLAAFVPSFIYYGSLFTGVYTYSLKIGAPKMKKADLPKISQVLKSGLHVFVTLPTLVVMLVLGYTAAKACFYALVVLVVVCALKKETRMGIKEFYISLKDGAEKSIGIMAACASMGIIIGSMDLTGFGTNLSYAIELFAGKNLMLCLALTMLASILLGMGVAPVATYIILVVMLAPVLEQLGLTLLTAHFFILYYSTYAVITPPVALAAYTGAGIAGANPFKTGIEAFKLGLPGFVLPFIFAYYPGLLSQFGMGQLLLSIVFSTLLLVPLNFANYSFFFTDMNTRNRILIVAAAVLMWFLKNSVYVGIAGFALLLFVLLDQFLKYKREKTSQTGRFAPGVSESSTTFVMDTPEKVPLEKIKKLEDIFRD